VDLWGGFELSPQVITTGFGYAVPPMMALLFILEVCGHILFDQKFLCAVPDLHGLL
jgi:hypothetical protein